MDILAFVEKKAHRNLAKRILKHSADEQKIIEFRNLLRDWLPCFGVSKCWNIPYSENLLTSLPKIGQKSKEQTVHDILEGIIDRKLRKLERSHSKNKDLPTVPRPSTPSSSSHPRTTTPPKPVTESVHPTSLLVSDSSLQSRPRPSSPGMLNGRRPMHPPPNISISPRVSSEMLPGHLPTPGLESRPQTADITQRARDEKLAREKAMQEAEARKKRLFQEDRIRKLAEKERWTRSQQEFIRLPDLNLNEVDLEDLPVASGSAIPDFPVSVIPATPATGRDDSVPNPYIYPPPSPPRALPKKPSLSNSDDERVAAALHAKMQKELELEDEREAKKFAAKLQLEMEAEERLKVHSKSRFKRKKPKLIDSPTPSGSDTDGPGGSILRHASRSPSPDPQSRTQRPRPKPGTGGTSQYPQPVLGPRANHQAPPGLNPPHSAPLERYPASGGQTITITSSMNLYNKHYVTVEGSDSE